MVPSFHDLLLNSPVLITIQRGKEPRIDLLDFFARAIEGRGLAGRPLSQALPELEEWLGRIGTVIGRGVPYIGVDEPLTLDWTGTGTVETRYLTSVCQPLLGSDGAVDGSVLFAIDVTANVLASTDGPYSRQWFEASLDCVATPVVFAEPRTRRILSANAAARRLSRGELPSGTTFGQAIGLETGYFCTDPAGGRMAEEEMPASRASRGDIVDALELQWHTPFGTVPLICFAEMVPETRALPSVVVLSFFDASRTERLERELVEAKSARDAFLDSAAHELRTPLTALTLQIQSLLRRYPEAAGLVAVERATARMSALVEQMLACARIREAGMPMQPEDLDLCAVVDDAIDRLRKTWGSASTLRRAGAPHASGRWDRYRLELVLTNLLSNALRFGAGAPIQLECRDLGNRVSATVSDQGIGIAPADQVRIFERFDRGTSSRHFGGLGLGLWLTREMVTEMGGSISVRSAIGHGATFTVELPKAPPASALTRGGGADPRGGSELS